VEDADRVLAASFMNLSAVADAISEAEDVLVVCAGKEDRFALDDALCAGNLIKKVVEGREVEVVLNDAGRVALELAAAYSVSTEFLRTTSAGAALADVGLARDLEHCASLDRYSFVPEMKERQIRVPGGLKGDSE
jgi:2-phosphosulfolactate phosphatase